MATTARFLRGSAALVSVVHDGARYLTDGGSGEDDVSNIQQMDTNDNETLDRVMPDGYTEEPSDDERTGVAFLMVSTAILSVVAFATLLCLFQMCRIVFCKAFARLNPSAPAMFVDEGRVVQLDPRQRRAVLEAIFKETSKAITEEDINERRRQRKDRKRVRKAQSYDGDEDEEDRIPSDVNIPFISTCDSATSFDGGHTESTSQAESKEVPVVVAPTPLVPTILPVAPAPLKRSLSWNDLHLRGDVKPDIGTWKTSGINIPMPAAAPMKRSVSESTPAPAILMTIPSIMSPGAPVGNSSAHEDQQQLVIKPSLSWGSPKPLAAGPLTSPGAAAAVVTLSSPITKITFASPGAKSASSSPDNTKPPFVSPGSGSMISSPGFSRMDHEAVTPSAGNVFFQDDKEEDSDDDELALPALDMAAAAASPKRQDMLHARAIMSRPPPPMHTRPIPLAHADSFTTTSEYTFDDETEDFLCSICLSGYAKGDVIISSKHCSHLFHKDCILEWLDKHDECPECRAHMVTESDLGKAAASMVDEKKKRKLEARREISTILVHTNILTDNVPPSNRLLSGVSLAGVNIASYRTPPTSPRPRSRTHLTPRNSGR